MEEQITTGQVAKKWGLIYGLITALVSVIPLIIEFQSSWLGFLPIPIAIVVYILAMKEFKTANGGYMTFGEGFRIAMVTALIGAVLRYAVYYVYVKLVDPGVNERMQEVMKNQLRDQGRTEQEIEQMSGFMSGFSNPEVIVIMGIIFVILGGLVWGAIVSAVMKNEAEDF